MALFRRSLKCCIPLLLALVIVIGMLPVTLASAADSTTYGIYLDGSLIVSASFESSSVVVRLNVYDDYFRVWFDGFEETYYYREDYNSNDYQFSGLSTYSDLSYRDYKPNNAYEITLTSSSPNLNLYAVMWPYVEIDPNGGTWEGSSDVSTWAAPEDDGGPVADPVRYGYEFAGWTLTGAGSLASSPSSTQGSYIYTFGDGAGYLTAKWVETSALSATFVCGDSSYVFYGTDTTLPEVTWTITSSGFTLTDGTVTYTHTEHGAVGYKLDPDVDGYYGIGEEFVFTSDWDNSGSYTQEFYPLYELPEATTYYTSTVYIYDNSGSTLLYTYQEKASGACPRFSMSLSSTGCTFVGNSTYSWTYDGEGVIAGVTTSRGSSSFVLKAGSSYSAGGGTQNYTAKFYLVMEDSGSDDSGSDDSGSDEILEDITFDFVSWLKVAVGGFLDFEIFPGLSLDEILYFILVVQLLMWFLKVAK